MNACCIHPCSFHVVFRINRSHIYLVSLSAHYLTSCPCILCQPIQELTSISRSSGGRSSLMSCASFSVCAPGSSVNCQRSTGLHAQHAQIKPASSATRLAVLCCSVLACLLACLPACLWTLRIACMLACLHACLLASSLACSLALLACLMCLLRSLMSPYAFVKHSYASAEHP